MLMAGLGMEAVIFFFSAFEKPHVEHDWSLVYPELAHMQDPNSAKRPAQLLDDALEKAKIDNELINFLLKSLFFIPVCWSKLSLKLGKEKYGIWLGFPIDILL